MTGIRVIDLREESEAGIRAQLDALAPPSAETSEIDQAVEKIILDVRERGDLALADYSQQFDKYPLTPETIRVDPEEIRKHATGVDGGLVEALKKAIRNVREFHEQQVEKSWEAYAGDGVRLGQRITPIERVGLYIPGGKAAYPSSVIMNAVPAQVAGVERIAVVTPPRAIEENPLVAKALELLGIDEVYRIGGAQAIAALAYGTSAIPRVDKIVGPGNQYVQSAKRQVWGTVGIDMVAGPSEVAIIADETCDPGWAAADLLAQAEHDEWAGAWLICWSEGVAASVFDEVLAQLATLDRNAIAQASLNARGAIMLVENADAAIALVNRMAPEHVQVLMAEPDRVADGIRHAGALFVGRYAPTPVGDYFAGPSHVLPTGGAARFFSPLGVADFMKRTSLIRYSGRAIERFGAAIEGLATAEGLTGHARSIAARRH